MKKTILFLSMGLLFVIPLLAKANCFLVKEGEKVLINEGKCHLPHSPYCSFNIALSLMGFNEGILRDEDNPRFPFRKGYPAYFEKWQYPHTPYLWIKNSCLWYSQVLTKKLGMKNFHYYVRKFEYGTKDVSGDKGKNNGLERSWMSGSSLKISAKEQVAFLQNLLDQKLGVSPKAYEMTKNITFINNLADGWKLYGKSGMGYLPNRDGTLNEKRESIWFVGWIEKGKRALVFAYYVEQDNGGRCARKTVIKRLRRIVQSDILK